MSDVRNTLQEAANHLIGAGGAPDLAVRINKANAAVAELIEAADASPILSKYHGHKGLELELFVVDYNAWKWRIQQAIAAVKPSAPTSAGRVRE